MKEHADLNPADWYIAATGNDEFWTSERCYITELVNSDRCPEVSLAIARVEPGVRTQLHALSGIEEVYLVRSGRGVIEVEGVEQELGIGDQAVVAASAAQRITNIGDDDLVCLCLCRPRFRPECYVDLEAGTT